jgi:integrase
MYTTVSNEASNDADSRTTEQSDDARKDEQSITKTHDKSVSQVSRRSKSDTKHWAARLYKQVSGRGTVSPHWSVKIKHRGRRVAFSLHTGNKDAAARRAMNIFNAIVDKGWDAVLAERRNISPEVPSSGTITIGDWITAAQKVFAGSPTTFASYARALRFIASEIVDMNKTSKRFERAQSGEYRRKVDACPLAILSPAAIQAWKISYVSKNGTDPAKARAARITANATLRNAKALFSKRVMKFIELRLDPLPFADLEFYPRESMRYHSKLDPQQLLQAASQELAESDPEAFKVLVLALGAGLRRGEVDRLLWRQIDCAAGIIHIEITEAGSLKTPGSMGQVHIDETLASVLQGFKAKATSEYVIEAEAKSPMAPSSPWSRRYRGQGVFDRLVKWLRNYGIENRNAVHVLRKEAGSIVATEHGLFAASRFLRHNDIRTTQLHYSDLKKRVTVDMGALLQPKNIAELPSKAKRASGS